MANRMEATAEKIVPLRPGSRYVVHVCELRNGVHSSGLSWLRSFSFMNIHARTAVATMTVMTV